MSNEIQLSPKHGLNPTLCQCFFCGEPTGEIAIMGRLPNDAEAPRMACLNLDPCKKCGDLMKQGVIIMVVTDESYAAHQDDVRKMARTGHLMVLKEEAMDRLIDKPEAVAVVKKRRWAMMPHAFAEHSGLIEAGEKFDADKTEGGAS